MEEIENVKDDELNYSYGTYIFTRNGDICITKNEGKKIIAIWEEFLKNKGHKFIEL